MDSSQRSEQTLRARYASALGLALALALIVTYYAFVATAGHFNYWPEQGLDWGYYYDTQAEGFRDGHLYTSKIPSPRLLAVVDPHDRRYRHLWNWDYSLYGRHLYLYWGLTPAALLALVKHGLGVQAPVRDAALVFAFSIGRLLVGSGLIRSLARHFTPRPPAWSVWLALFVFAVANPTPFSLARPAVYEAALSGGSFFLVAALWAACSWIFCEQPATRLLRLAVASVCLALAGTCRPSLLPTGALISVLLLLHGWRRAGGQLWPPRLGRAELRLSAAALVPFGTLVLIHLLINQLRFGSWAEFGARYQLGNVYQMGLRFVPANLWHYLFHRLRVSCRFPFVNAPWTNDLPANHELPSWLPAPAAYYTAEPVAGLLSAVPFVCLGLAPLLCFAWLRRSPRLASVSVCAVDARWRWVWWMFALASVSAAFPVLTLFAFSMRYEMEFSSTLLLLAMLGGWWLLVFPFGRVGSWLVRVSYAALAVVSVLIGVAFGFSGYFELFEHHNAALFQTLRRDLHLCASR